MGWGILHVKGWGSKSSSPPSKVCFFWASSEGAWDVPDLRGCSKSSRKKVRAHFFDPNGICQGVSEASRVLCAVCRSFKGQHDSGQQDLQL